MNAAQPFIWGSGGRRLTPEEVLLERKNAQALGQEAMSTAPIGHQSQGWARILQGLMAGYDDYRAGDASRQNAGESGAVIQALLGGGAVPAVASPTAVPAMAAAPAAVAPVLAPGPAYAGGPIGAQDMDAMVRTIQAEAGNQDMAGRQAVGNAILNRSTQSGMPISDVVTAKGQFEPWGTDAGRARMAALDPNSRAYQEAELAALNAQEQDVTAGATHFYAPRAQAALGRRAPAWDDGTGRDIGDHRFFAHGYNGNGAHGIPTNALAFNGTATQGAPQAAAAPAAATGAPQINPAIVKALSSPYVSDQARKIGGMLFQNQLEQQTKANDPMRALQMEKLRADIAKAKGEGGANEYGLTPQYGVDEAGNPVMVQLGKNGKPIRVQMPEGVKLSKEPIRIDAGTHFVLMDPITRQQIGVVPKNLAQAASDKAVGTAQGTVKASLPTDLQTAKQTVSEIDSLLNNKGLSSVVGPLDQYRPSWTMGAEGRDALARYNQLKGRSFLQAFSMLKGAGQITEVEGTKAENAMARMDRAQSEEDFKTALRDFREAVVTGTSKLREKAGLPAEEDTARKTSSGVSWSVE